MPGDLFLFLWGLCLAFVGVLVFMFYVFCFRCGVDIIVVFHSVVYCLS